MIFCKVFKDIYKMEKILLIIQREYLTRVRKKAFIVMIFVVPALVLLMTAIVALVAKNSSELNKLQIVKVIDESDVFQGKFHDIKNLKFEPVKESLSDIKKDLKDDENLLALVIMPNFTLKDGVEIWSKKKPGFVVMGAIEQQMHQIALNDGLVKNHIDPLILKSIKSDITLNPIQITDDGANKTNIVANIGVGIACAILIYISLVIYGAQVMRGVIEEKTSRIIEVIISYVKHFQLMLVKIIGVGLVCLTQFGAWIILSIISILIFSAYN